MFFETLIENNDVREMALVGVFWKWWKSWKPVINLLNMTFNCKGKLYEPTKELNLFFNFHAGSI